MEKLWQLFGLYADTLQVSSNIKGPMATFLLRAINQPVILRLLTQLDVSDSFFDTLPEKVIAPLPKLKRLYLRNSHITEVDKSRSSF